MVFGPLIVTSLTSILSSFCFCSLFSYLSVRSIFSLSTSSKLDEFRQIDVDVDTQADYEAVRARSAGIGLQCAFDDLDDDISANAAGGPRPSIGVDFQEGIRAELNTGAISPSPRSTKSTPLSQLPSGDSPLQSEDLSALNFPAFPAVLAAEPAAPLAGTQQVASSAAQSAAHSFASASSGMSPR